MKNQELIDAITQVVKAGDEEDRKKLFDLAAHSKIIDNMFAIRLWHEYVEVGKCDNDQLREVAKAWSIEVDRRHLDYIEDPKGGFLDTMPYDATKTAYTKNILDSFSRYEETCDVTELSREDALQMLHEMKMISRDKVTRVISTLSQYAKWRVRRGLPVSDAFVGDNRIVPKDIAVTEGETAKFILSAEELADIIDADFRRLEDMGPVCTCLTWMGFTKKQMVDLKNEDVNIFEGTVLNGRIPDEFVKFFRIYTEEDQKFSEAGFGFRKRFREDLGYFVKRWVSVPRMKRVTEGTISDSMKDLDRVNYNAIRLSGMMNRVYKREQSKGRLAHDDFVEICQLNAESASIKKVVENKTMVYSEYKKILES